jgi:hypothetical protein
MPRVSAGAPAIPGAGHSYTPVFCGWCSALPRAFPWEYRCSSSPLSTSDCCACRTSRSATGERDCCHSKAILMPSFCFSFYKSAFSLLMGSKGVGDIRKRCEESVCCKPHEHNEIKCLRMTYNSSHCEGEHCSSESRALPPPEQGIQEADTRRDEH